MNQLHTTMVLLLALTGCRGAHSSDTTGSSKSMVEVPPDQAKPDHYCDVYPEKCRPCPGEPGSCGGEPMAGACCCEGGGCVGVGLATDCDPACDFWPCEWGYQTQDEAGVPVVVCFDED